MLSRRHRQKLFPSILRHPRRLFFSIVFFLFFLFFLPEQPTWFPVALGGRDANIPFRGPWPPVFLSHGPPLHWKRRTEVCVGNTEVEHGWDWWVGEREMVIITMGHPQRWEELRATVAAVQEMRPRVDIWVFDQGLNKEDAALAGMWANVRLVQGVAPLEWPKALLLAVQQHKQAVYLAPGWTIADGVHQQPDFSPKMTMMGPTDTMRACTMNVVALGVHIDDSNSISALHQVIQAYERKIIEPQSTDGVYFCDLDAFVAETMTNGATTMDFKVQPASPVLLDQVLYRCSHGDTPSACRPHSPSLLVGHDRKQWVLATAVGGKDKFFVYLQNLVASVQYWEPDLEIEIFDVGMSSAQREEAAGWKNVHVRSFPFDSYPPHVRTLGNYAWKPLLYQLVLKERERFLYVDTSVEIRAPLDPIFDKISTQGYFYVAQEGKYTNLQCCGKVLELTHKKMFEWFGLDRRDFADADMIAGGIQGYMRHSTAHWDVLRVVVECALDPLCIAPVSSKSTHRFDQSAFSISVAARDLVIQRDAIYWANPKNQPHGELNDPAESKGVVLFIRRDWGAPYKSFLQYK